MLDNRYQNLQKLLKINFKNLKLLDLAFIHKSYLNENRQLKDAHNERLEFLGDAVLELLVTDYLYKNYPDQEEGVLTSWRSALVNGEHLAKIAIELDLGLYLYLSRGEERSGGRKKNYILANTFEALLGAIYLDQGLKKAEKFVEKYLLPRLLEIVKQGTHIDSKSKLQEKSQESLGITPQYFFISESGPDHNKKFVMEVRIGDAAIAKGEGSSKQKAEVEAARKALQVQKWN